MHRTLGTWTLVLAGLFLLTGPATAVPIADDLDDMRLGRCDAQVDVACEYRVCPDHRCHDELCIYWTNGRCHLG